MLPKNIGKEATTLESYGRRISFTLDTVPLECEERLTTFQEPSSKLVDSVFLGGSSE